jgi:hypothetical protein
MAFLTLSPTERYKSITVKVTTTGDSNAQGFGDLWAMYAATAFVPVPPKLRTSALTSRQKALVNKPFTYKVSAKNLDVYLDTLYFRMQLPDGVALRGFSSSLKMSTFPTVNEGGMLTWTTPLQSGKSVRLSLKLTADDCADNLKLLGQWYKDSVLASYVNTPLKKNLMVTGPGCSLKHGGFNKGTTASCECKMCKCTAQYCKCSRGECKCADNR